MKGHGGIGIKPVYREVPQKCQNGSYKQIMECLSPSYQVPNSLN